MIYRAANISNVVPARTHARTRTHNYLMLLNISLTRCVHLMTFCFDMSDNLCLLVRTVLASSA